MHLKVVIQDDNSEPIVYEYKKQMPEDIDPDKCTYKVNRNRLNVHTVNVFGTPHLSTYFQLYGTFRLAYHIKQSAVQE